ncbi:F-box protein: endocytic membrane traffic, recycling ReCYcling 1 [Mycoemilia scoparia]|uniref:F-box protein: endocytic membrane traffic, recycling ReCYcling 1 n=1 Tax=Mycoemilia scoparia TaxID=417184 RepID=A0A9W8AAH6_9FUNG|nr:F-box protein: endocytic membrane traffic, recycling ReCYcling 1 [Mycoemilia scoparia]
MHATGILRQTAALVRQVTTGNPALLFSKTGKTDPNRIYSKVNEDDNEEGAIESDGANEEMDSNDENEACKWEYRDTEPQSDADDYEEWEAVVVSATMQGGPAKGIKVHQSSESYIKRWRKPVNRDKKGLDHAKLNPRKQDKKYSHARKHNLKRSTFLRLQPKVVLKIMDYLPIQECLSLTALCTTTYENFGPGGRHSVAMWQGMLMRMGWVRYIEAIGGRPRRLRWIIPRTMGQLLYQHLEITDESILTDMLSTHSYEIFASIHEVLIGDYVDLGLTNNPIPSIYLTCNTKTAAMLENAESSPKQPSSTGYAHQGKFCLRDPADMAVRLDQLLWFSKGNFLPNSEVINRRLFALVRRFETHYTTLFERTYDAKDSKSTKEICRVLQNLREGRCCIQYLLSVNPLVSSNYLDTTDYQEIISLAKCAKDVESFEEFVSLLSRQLESNSVIFGTYLPSPRLPAGAMCALLDIVFKPSGIVYQAFRNLFYHLQVSLEQPIKAHSRADSVIESSQTISRKVAPADHDAVYIGTIYSTIKSILAEAEAWAVMKPISIPLSVSKHHIFSIYEAVICDYTSAEISKLRDLYGRELDRWALKLQHVEELFSEPQASHSSRATKDTDTHHGGYYKNRMINFQKHIKDMENYKYNVLDVFKNQIGITLDIKALERLTDSSRVMTSKIIGEIIANVDPSQNSDDSKPATPGFDSLGDVLVRCPISVDLCLNMLIPNRDSVSRISVFANAPPSLKLRHIARESIEEVFSDFLRAIGQRHIRPSFERVIPKLQELESSVETFVNKWYSSSNTESQNEADREANILARAEMEKELHIKCVNAQLRFFELVHMADLVTQMIEIYYKKEMAPFIQETDFLNICNQEKRALERMLDDNVALGMDCIIEIIIRRIQQVLKSEQAEYDYNPSDSASLQLKPTLACVHAIQLLTESTEVVQAMTTNKQIRDVYLGEVGLRLYTTLVDHIKRFKINEPGGFQLIADLNLFYDWAEKHLEDTENLVYFLALKDLANCFILAPKDLKPFLRDQYTRRKFDSLMRLEEVYDIVACRADYSRIRTTIEGHCEFM